MKRVSLTLITCVLLAGPMSTLLMLMPDGRTAAGQSGSGERRSNSNRTTSKQPPSKKGATANSNRAKNGKAATPKSFRNHHGIEMLWIPPGSFQMGSNNGRPDERPVHRVTIGQGFYMSKYELTQAQWLSVTGTSPTPNYQGHENEPIYWLTWHEAQDVISKLNQLDDGYLYRMPTEAEWEYACRAGTTGEYYARNLDDIGWYNKNSGSKFHPVGGKQPNAFGLYDMVGNTREWCEDWHQVNYHGAPADGSAWIAGDEKGLRRVLRGGSAYSSATALRSAYRSWASQDYQEETGLRLVAVAMRAP